MCKKCKLPHCYSMDIQIVYRRIEIRYHRANSIWFILRLIEMAREGLGTEMCKRSKLPNFLYYDFLNDMQADRDRIPLCKQRL